jgi:hypothetical protein
MLSGRMVGDLIRSALDTLPADFRAVLMLVDVQELNYVEAARVLGVPTGTIKSRVSRGRAMMRHTLGGLARIQGLSVALPTRRFVARNRARPGRGVRGERHRSAQGTLCEYVPPAGDRRGL